MYPIEYLPIVLNHAVSEMLPASTSRTKKRRSPVPSAIIPFFGKMDCE